MRLYLETSAAAKLLLEEAETESLRTFIDTSSHDIVSTSLLETELRRIGWREQLPQTECEDVLDLALIHELPAAAYTQAGLLPTQHLRSLDALHVVGALRLNVDAILAYDTRVQEASGTVGLQVVAPNAAAIE